MALFDFVCNKCQHVFEWLIMKQGDEPKVCPKCGSAEVKKRLGYFRIKMWKKKGE